MQGCMISRPIKENEMGGASGIHGGKYDQGFGGETRVKETTRVDGRIIIKRILKK
jgi:hypothetical protein